MNGNKELQGRVAIVTGAGRNIGRAMALELAAGGAAVVVNTRSNMAQAEGVAKEIEAAGGQAVAFAGDVADAAAVDRMVAATVATVRAHRLPDQQRGAARRAAARAA